MRDLQRQRGLRPIDEVDEATVAVLLELEERITINIHEDAVHSTQPDEHRGRVHGTLVDQDGTPVPGQRVVALSRRVHSETPLGETKTDRQGVYSIRYKRPRALSVFVRAYDEKAAQFAESFTAFAADVDVQLDLTTSADGIVRQPSLFTRLQTQVLAELHGAALGDLEESKDAHELTLLAQVIDAPFKDVARASSSLHPTAAEAVRLVPAFAAGAVASAVGSR